MELMKNINYKKLIRVIVWIIFVVFFVGYVKRCAEIDTCLDMGQGVWDYDQNRCRSDCLKWTKETGCVPLPTKNPQGITK